MKKAALLFLIASLCGSCSLSGSESQVTQPAQLPDIQVPEPTRLLTESTRTPTIETQIHQLRIEFSTTSDWSDLVFLDPQTKVSFEISAIEGDSTYFVSRPDGLYLHQPLEKAIAGNTVKVSVDYRVSVQEGVDSVKFQMRKGNINGSMVRIFEQNDNALEQIFEYNHDEIIGKEGINPLNFSLDLISMTPSLAKDPEPDTTTEDNVITDHVSMVIFNGVVLTMEESQPRAEAVAIQGDTILAIGSSDEILELAESNTLKIDLAGRTLLPGIVDPHNHLLNSENLVPLHQAPALALRNGITTIANLFTDESNLEAIEALDNEGSLSVRTSLYLNYNDACGIPMGDWYKDYTPNQRFSDMLRIGGIKIYSDGGACNVPAVSFEYPGGYGNGDIYFTQEEMNQVVSDLDTAGFQLAIHALGDRAITLVLNAYENLLGGSPNLLRHRIEHNTFLSPGMMPRYNQIGPVPLIFGPFPTCAKLGSETKFKYSVPDSYKTWEWAWRDLLDTNPGLKFSWHSDYSVFTLDPMIHLFGFTTRAQIDEDGTICKPPDWIEANAINVEEALPMMTINAAYALFMEDDVGSIKPGKFADLVILSGDPTRVDPYAIPDIDVLMTMVSGQVEFCVEDRTDICP